MGDIPTVDVGAVVDAGAASADAGAAVVDAGAAVVDAGAAAGAAIVDDFAALDDDNWDDFGDDFDWDTWAPTGCIYNLTLDDKLALLYANKQLDFTSNFKDKSEKETSYKILLE